MDIRKRKAQVPYYSNTGQVVRLCMTSAEDVARFVVAALELPQWPTEFRMQGDRMSVSELVQVAGMGWPGWCFWRMDTVDLHGPCKEHLQ